MSKAKKKIIIWSIVGGILLAMILACFIYLGIYYRANSEEVNEFLSNGEIQPREIEKGIIAFEPENPTAGLIFYQGGKVEHEAYYPLMQKCAENGILCVVVKMPFRLAVFGVNKADRVCEKYPEIKSWYMCGHSLGGSMAASYLSKHENDFKGIILLASYSTAELKDSHRVLSIYGSCDKVLNLEKYEENKANLPNGFAEYIIDGGNHAYFGMYGEQKGDGAATISNTEQIIITADLIISFILEN